MVVRLLVGIFGHLRKFQLQMYSGVIQLHHLLLWNGSCFLMLSLSPGWHSHHSPYCL